MRAAALVGVALIACKGGNAAKQPADSTAAQLATPGRVAAPQPAATAREATPVSVAAEVKATCGAVAGFWRRFDSTDVRQVDSLVKSYETDTTVNACVVFVYQEHGNRSGPGVAVDTAAQHLETALALVRGAGPGWVPLYHFQADGPDGSSLVYQRGRVRCLVEHTSDGGDDSDSTYVPADWFKEQTTCWMMPRGLIVSDTAMGR